MGGKPHVRNVEEGNSFVEVSFTALKQNPVTQAIRMNMDAKLFLKLPRLLWYFFVVLTAKKIWSKDRSPCGKKSTGNPKKR